MPDTFFLIADPSDNKTIRWEQAFLSPYTQIKVYPAVSSGGYDVIRCQVYKRTAVSEPFHQVYINFFSDFFVLVHIVGFMVYFLNPRLGFFFIFFFTGICSSGVLLGSGVRIPKADDKPKLSP